MSACSGLGRVFNGSGADRVSRSNLTEFRGNLWEAVNDWFFGYTSVDFDWSDPADATKFRRWVYTAADSIDNQVTIDPATHQATIEAVAGTADGSSNERDLFVIDETATWGVAHAQCEIVCGPKYLSGGTPDENQLRVIPQHGIGLRAQEDVKRRTIIAWHDVAFSLPQVINLGVWSGNLDGTGFVNRQISMAMDLDDVYTVTAATKVNDDDAGLVFDGTGTSCWQTPDTPALDIATDFRMKFDIAPADWTPAGPMSIYSKYLTTGNQRSYRVRLATTGAIEVVVTTDGSTQKTFATDAAGTAILAALGNGVRRSIGVDFDADNGAAGATATFYIAENYQGPWTQLGGTATVAGSITTIFNGTAVGELGSVNVGAVDRFNGRIHRFELRPGRWTDVSPQPAVVDVRPHAEADAVTSFVDNVGLTWTKSGTAVLENTQPGVITATIGTHQLRVGDRINARIGEELSITAMARAGGQNCSATLPGGHNIETGSFVRLLFSSDASFDGSFYVTVSGNTMSWVDAGSNTSGHTALLWDHTWATMTATVTAVGATTVSYESPGKAKATIPTTGNSYVQREFPYFMEARVAGTVAQVRCWGRHQTIPDWLDQDRALIVDLTKPGRSFNVSLRERTSNVATLTIGAHDLMVGDRVNIAGVEATFNATNRIVTAFTDTTVSYANTGTDVGSTASTGTCAAVGSGTAADINANPCPTGSGRVAFAAAHLGNNTLSRCVYGPFFGDNDFDSTITPLSFDQATNVLRGSFSFPQVTAGEAGTPATVTPAVLASAFALPAASESVGAGPAVTAGVVAMPQAVESVGAGPATAAGVFALPAATESVGAGPAVLSGAFVLPAAAESVGAAPSEIARALTVPSATVSVGAAPAILLTSATLPQATPVTAGNATALPAVLAGVFALPQAAAQGSATVTASVLTAVAALGQAVESVGAGPAVIARAFVLPQAVPQTAGNVTVTPLVIDRAFLLPAVSVTAAGVASPVTLAQSLVMPQAVGSSPALAAPAVLARSMVLPATAVVVAAQATPAAIAVIAALATPGVGVGVSPASLALVFLLGSPSAGSYPPDPHPTHLTFGGQDGGVTFAQRTGLIIFRRRQ